MAEPNSKSNFELFPLPLPSPARGEGKYNEIQKEIPSPSTGEGWVGVILLMFFCNV